jgi:hypothetical protein
MKAEHLKEWFCGIRHEETEESATRTPSQDGRTPDVQMERMRKSGRRSTNDARDNVPPGLVDSREASNRYPKMHSHNRGFVRVHQFG